MIFSRVNVKKILLLKSSFNVIPGLFQALLGKSTMYLNQFGKFFVTGKNIWYFSGSFGTVFEMCDNVYSKNINIHQSIIQTIIFEDKMCGNICC
jgi:hypothetical protein